MKILDSNIWIALFHENDNQNKKAIELFKGLNLPVAITEYVVLETCSILAKKASKKVADKFLEEILDNQDVLLLLSNESYFWEVISGFKEMPSNNLSFVDISLLCLSKSYEVVTFDRKLNNELNKKSPLREFFELRKKFKTKMTVKDIIKAAHKGRLSYDPKKRKTFREGI